MSAAYLPRHRCWNLRLVGGGIHGQQEAGALRAADRSIVHEGHQPSACQHHILCDLQMPESCSEAIDRGCDKVSDMLYHGAAADLMERCKRGEPGVRTSATRPPLPTISTLAALSLCHIIIPEVVLHEDCACMFVRMHPWGICAMCSPLLCVHTPDTDLSIIHRRFCF